MFLGEFNHTIDDKGRLTLPAKFRAELAAGVVVTRGIDKHLAIYPMTEWQKVADKLDRFPQTKEDARTLVRLMLSGANDIEPDKQGRILLPANLRAYAELDGEVVIIGMNTHLEVWNLERWHEKLTYMEEHSSEIAERLADLGIL